MNIVMDNLEIHPVIFFLKNAVAPRVKSNFSLILYSTVKGQIVRLALPPIAVSLIPSMSSLGSFS